ncbi:putative transcriptional regulator [Methanococcus maripaludis]|uniref:Putative transcriptional regulator n=1 Tax=Methanococcus maripaludis TaxID=39152 RepID=A0A7J9NV61_METMI|nr:DUF2683 family protein [Methanococcus maripaludis]MBA2851559.1 putative transcriptional regulator [Methanococcus maripaludis]
MVSIKVDLSDEANQIVEIYKGVHGLKSKQEAIIQIINIAGAKHIEETIYTPDFIAQIKASEKDIKAGRVISTDEVDDLDDVLDNYEKEEKKKKLTSRKKGNYGKNKIH